MFIKSFFKNKKNRKKLCLVTSLLIIFFLWKNINQLYINKVNTYYEDTYIEFITNAKDYEQIKNIKNVASIEAGVIINIEGSLHAFYKDDSLKENEVKINTFAMEKHPGETINLEEKIYIIKEVDQYTWAGGHYTWAGYMHPDVLEYHKAKDAKVVYHLNLKDWSLIRQTEIDLKKLHVYHYEIENDPYNKLPNINFINSFRIIKKIIIGILLILLLYIFYTIFYEEQEYNYFYANIGFKRIKREWIIIKNVVLLFLLALLLAFSIASIIKIIWII